GDTDLGDGGALETGKQDAAKAVANGCTEAAFERFDDQPGVRIRADRVIAHHLGRQFEATPLDSHFRIPPMGNSAKRLSIYSSPQSTRKAPKKQNRSDG